MSPNPTDVTQSLSRSQLKYESDKYKLWHLGAVTANADMLVICGDTINHPDFPKPLAVPVHRKDVVALKAKYLVEGTEMMEGVKKTRNENNSGIDELIIDIGVPYKGVLNYFMSIYDFKNMKSSKRRAKSLMDVYMMAFHLGDDTTKKELQPVIKKSVSEGKFEAYEVYSVDEI